MSLCRFLNKLTESFSFICWSSCRFWVCMASSVNSRLERIESRIWLSSQFSFISISPFIVSISIKICCRLIWLSTIIMLVSSSCGGGVRLWTDNILGVVCNDSCFCLELDISLRWVCLSSLSIFDSIVYSFEFSKAILRT